MIVPDKLKPSPWSTRNIITLTPLNKGSIITTDVYIDFYVSD